MKIYKRAIEGQLCDPLFKETYGKVSFKIISRENSVEDLIGAQKGDVV